ncbi:MAG: hypothetical protein GC156_03670 [Actinomycetales bacterium]|nr:hypothetical protein [Actinomycetales bacterium]
MRLSIIGGAFVVLVIGAALWLLLLSPRLSEANKLSTQAEQLQNANLQLQHEYKVAVDQAAAAPQAAAEAQALFARMPQTAELPAVLDQITRAAVDAGISAGSVSSLTTGIPTPVSGTKNATTTEKSATGVQLARMEIGVTAEGQYPSVLGFLDNLQGLDRAMLVTSTQTSQVSTAGTSTGPDLQNVQVNGSMFVLQSQLPDLVAEVEALIAKAEQDQAALPGAETSGDATTGASS